jgi:hypothetical protein
MTIESEADARRAFKSRARRISTKPSPERVMHQVTDIDECLQHPPKRSGPLKKLLLRIGAYLSIKAYKTALSAGIAYAWYELISGGVQHVIARAMRSDAIAPYVALKNKVTGSKSADAVELQYMQSALRVLLAGTVVLAGKQLRDAPWNASPKRRSK